MIQKILLLKTYRTRIVNASLRIFSLVAKLALTLYMGKYLTLNDLGVYGLVFAEVMMLGTIMGIHIDYRVSRELVDKPPLLRARYIRDVAAFYGLNFVLLTVLFLAGFRLHLFNYPVKILMYIYLIGILETLANTFYSNMNAMNQQVNANILFFFRSGLWAIIIIAGGLFFPFFHNIDVILTGWLCGLLMCLAGTFWYWREFPWAEVIKLPVDWNWIKKHIKKSVFIWIGGIGLIGGGYIDRFITDRYLRRDIVGIITFYSSFTVGVFTLLQSAVFAFASPRMVSLYQQGSNDLFWKEVKHTTRHALLLSSFVCLCIGCIVPFFGVLLHQPLLHDNALTLWLMLIAVSIRVMAEILFSILFARGQDGAVWTGDLLFIVPVIAGNVMMLPHIGLPAVGYSSILAASVLALWRLWHVIHFNKTPALAVGAT